MWIETARRLAEVIVRLAGRPGVDEMTSALSAVQCLFLSSGRKAGCGLKLNGQVVEAAQNAFIRPGVD